MFQGDVHRFFLRLRRQFPTPPAGPLPDLDHVRAIARYYAQLDPKERQLLLAWARKEESGIGLIPASLSTVPLLGLMFAPVVHVYIRQMATWIWVTLWLAGILLFTSGIYIHHRQKAFTTLHIQLLEQLSQNHPSQTS